jgi:hypothetical protein
MDTRLRVGRAIGKTKEDVACDLMAQLKDGEPSEVLAHLGGHTAYVERTNLTSRQMNGRLVRKTLSYSKQLVALRAACAWEDWVYNLTRSVDTLSLPVQIGQHRWKRQSPAMAAKLTDHIWTIKELLTTVVPHMPSTAKGETTRQRVLAKV